MAAASAAAPRLLVATLLAIAVLAAFWPVLSADFINHDDDFYVTRNPIVQRGITAESVRWAWTATVVANWHPLTWMAHMLDWELFGPSAAGHHATSLVLHVVNTLLVFWMLDGMTGAPWRSALVAALFGLHPLHVESVAWVSERKDVLSTCFWLLATIAWVGWVRRGRAWRYALSAACLALGLAAKPMLVTLPFTLLLLDWWPLRRLAGVGHGAWPLVREKVPLFAVIVAAAVTTVFMQSGGEAVASLEEFPLAGRLENAVVAYATYLWKTVRPLGLTLPYPYLDRPGWQVAGSLLVLAGMTAAAVLLRRTRPYLLVGWLWYVGTLVPVIGLLQVGAQPYADRFTYVPLIGIFVAAAWALPAAVPRAVAAVVVAVVLLLGVLTHAQARRWHDSVTLFSNAVAVEDRNPVAHTLLGMAFADRSETQLAKEHLERALELRPEFAAAHVALGAVLSQLGQTDQAVAHYEAALAVDPVSLDALSNLGVARLRQGRLEEARAAFDRAVEIDPENARTLDLLGATLVLLGRPEEGLVPIDRALALSPEYARAHASRAGGLYELGRYAEAWAAVNAARAHGVEPPAGLLRLLGEKMPEPQS